MATFNNGYHVKLYAYNAKLNCLFGDFIHMDQIPQDGENEQNVSYFFLFFRSFALTKRFNFFSSFLNCSEEMPLGRWSLKILSFWY